jgi:hypothetical protein
VELAEQAAGCRRQRWRCRARAGCWRQAVEVLTATVGWVGLQDAGELGWAEPHRGIGGGIQVGQRGGRTQPQPDLLASQQREQPGHGLAGDLVGAQHDQIGDLLGAEPHPAQHLDRDVATLPVSIPVLAQRAQQLDPQPPCRLWSWAGVHHDASGPPTGQRGGLAGEGSGVVGVDHDGDLRAGRGWGRERRRGGHRHSLVVERPGPGPGPRDREPSLPRGGLVAVRLAAGRRAHRSLTPPCRANTLRASGSSSRPWPVWVASSSAVWVNDAHARQFPWA